MSKIKFGFSFFFAIFLVGILSTAAFATGGPYNLKATWNGTGFDVLFNVLDNSQSTTGFKIDMLQKDATGAYTVDILNQFATSVDAASLSHNGLNNGKATIAPTDTKYGKFDVGITYQVVLYASDGTTVLEKEYAVFTNSENDPMLSIGHDKTVDNQTLTVDPQGSGLVNVNQTGYGNLSKKGPNGKSVHGFYQNNVNACASCHQTHTAADGEYLLFKDGIYSTCSACHDGTTGAANSFEPAGKDTPTSIAGTFNVHDAGQNGSLHEADGSLKISAAPGGNRTPNSAVGSATYGGDFDCASCHAAHGSGSNKENNLNLDPLGWGGVAYKANGTADEKNGKLFINVGIFTTDTVPTTETTPYILVKKTLAAADISTDKTKAGYMYSRAGLVAGDTVLQTYRWASNKYVADYSLFLRDVGHVSAPFANANTAFFNGTTDITKNLNIIWRDGFVYKKADATSSDFDNITSANISLGIDVEDTDNIASLFDSKNPNYVYDSGTEMSKYCASCHVDYASVTRGDNTGVYSTAHRHATLQDRLSCVRCHFAHGSEAQTMKDANDNTYWTLSTDGSGTKTPADAIKYLTDPNPSSAIKRYTGMSVCYACHGKGEQFASNPNNIDIPLAGDPGADRTTWTTGQ